MTAGTISPPTAEPGDFVAIGVAPEPVHRQAASEARGGYLVFRAEDGFEAAVPETLVLRAMEWTRNAAPDEWCGLIVGRLCEDDGHRHVVVLGIVPDADARATPTSVNTSHASEVRTRSLARFLYPDGIVVGWVHGHPHHGLFFSRMDRTTQRTWTQPHSLGMVVDPWSEKQIALYRGPGSELLSPVEGAACPPPTPTGEATAPAPSSPRGPTGVLALVFVLSVAAGFVHLHGRIDALEAATVGSESWDTDESEPAPIDAGVPAATELPDAAACVVDADATQESEPLAP